MVRTKGALVGLVVGIAAAAVDLDSIAQERELGTVFNNLVILVIPFVVGAVLARLLRMPRWGGVAVVGGVATVILDTVLMRLVPDHRLFGFDERLTTGVYVLAAVVGFVAAAWWVGESGAWWVRITISGLLASVLVASGAIQEPYRRWQEVRAFEVAGVPLLAPRAPMGLSLYATEVSPGEGEDGSPVVFLEYGRGSGSRVRLFIRPGTVATPEAACVDPYPTGSWGYESNPCRSLGGDRWVRRDPDGEILVVARHARALVQIEGEAVPEAELIAALGTLHPISAASLVSCPAAKPACTL